MTAKKFEQELKKCNTLKEVFDMCNKHYRTEDCKLGVLGKPLLINALVSALTVFNPVAR